MRVVALAFLGFLIAPVAAFATSETPPAAEIKTEAKVEAPAPAVTPPVAEAPKEEKSLLGKIFGGDNKAEVKTDASATATTTSATDADKAAHAEDLKKSAARHSDENADEREKEREAFIREREEHKAQILGQIKKEPAPAAKAEADVKGDAKKAQ